MPASPPPFGLHASREALTNIAQLHREATLRGCPKLGPEDLDRLRALDDELVAALEEGRVEAAMDADEAFHGVLLTAAGDPDLQVSAGLLTPRLRRLILWYFTLMSFTPIPGEHPAIIEALSRGDAEAAAELVERSFLAGGAALEAALQQAAG
jgi:DNA-binding GntR family transcriptional regulator